MKSYEILIIVVFICIAGGVLWYNYELKQQYLRDVEKQQLEAQKVKITNIHGDIVDAVADTNLLDKSITETYPDEIGFPEPAGKGVKNITPEPDMIAKYYTSTQNDVPLNNALRPIGACPISRPMSRDLPVANAPMCMATRDDSDMRLR